MNWQRTNGILAACALVFAACTSGTKSEEPMPSGTLQTGRVTATATVEDIDLASRLVTLRGPDGTSNTIKVDESVRNLPQIKKGDRVVATYYESLAYQAKKAGDAEAGVDILEGAGRAEPGAQPGAAAGRTVTVTVTIKAIDKTKPSITLARADGSTFTVVVRHPEKLQHVKVGDLVELTYTQALAISVEPATKY
jgi:Cu/Ag efflux protein CusF